MKTSFGLQRLSRKSVLYVSALATLVTGAQAANVDFVQNGGFEQISINQSMVIGPAFSNQLVSGWTNESSGFHGANNFVVLPGTGDTTGFTYDPNGTPTQDILYGPGNGVNNGLPATSPAGGNYLVLDGDTTTNAAMTQTISGLIPGQSYTLSFYYAGAQFFNQNLGTSGATTEQLQVSLGSQNQATPVLNNASHGFTGWQSGTMTFTAASASEVLSFLSVGTPNGEPPTILLDGVSLVGPAEAPTPEPASWALMLTSAAGLAGVFRLRRRLAASKN